MPPIRVSGRAGHTERGQSEVTGMILMVGVLAISTMLAGGAMVTNFMGAAAVPDATTDVAIDATGSNVTITHVGGDSIVEDDLEVLIIGESGQNRYTLASDAIHREGDGDRWFEPGERAVFSQLFIGDIEVRIVDEAEQTLVFDSTVTPTVLGDPANLSVTLDNTNSPVKENETLAVRATIENGGDRTGVQTVELAVGGTVVDSESVRLAGGTWEQIDLAWKTDYGDAGDYTVTVSSQNDSDSAPVTIRTPSNFEVVIAGTNEPVNESETLHVDGTITNSGEDSDVQVIPLEISGLAEPVDYVTVGLDQDESRSVTLNWSTRNGDAGTYEAMLSSLDDSASRTVLVQSADTPPYFTVRIDSTNEPVAAGENITVDATIENIGDRGGTQTITLNVSSQTNPVDTRSVNLSNGSDTTITLVWPTPNQAGQDTPYTATVSSANESASTQVNVTKKSEAGPTADAGGPYTVASGETVILDGGGSSDKQNPTFTWTIVSGNGTLLSQTGETVEYQAPTVQSPETATVELNVTDNKGSDVDTAQITITPGNPPIIDSVSVTESGGTGQDPYNYSAIWNVSDPDGDLVNVTIQATDGKGEVLNETTATFPESSNESGTTNLQTTDRAKEIRLIARDSDGLSATTTRRISGNNQDL